MRGSSPFRAGAAALSLLGCLMLPSAASAWPVDVELDVQVGADRFEKLTAVGWAEVEDPAVVQVEVLPAGELLVTGKAPGQTLVLLYAEGRFAVWRVRVRAKGEPPSRTVGAREQLSAARQACPGIKVTEPGTDTPSTLQVRVNDARCRKALAALFESGGFRAGDLELVFDVPMLQAQLADIQGALKRAGLDVEVRYSGAGLVLEGKVTPAQHRKALWLVFKNSIGRVPLDDRTQELP